MGTKAIAEALDALKRWSHHAADVRKAEAAEKELEAIRKAAKALARFYGGKERTDSERALALMESIAKERP